MSARPEDPSTWTDRLNVVITDKQLQPVDLSRFIDRVMVIAETESTQDAAIQLAGGRPGLMALAVRQTAGRGRLGRAWADTSHLGVAITFVLDATRFGLDWLSLAAGLAARQAVDIYVNEVFIAAEIGLRWPNDVVEKSAPHRKVAGVLVEVRDGLALVGIGINVLQMDSDWAVELRERAVSIRRLMKLTNPPDRCSVAGSVVACLCDRLRHLELDLDKLAAEWSRYDILRNTRRSFVHNNQTYAGLVQSIDPTNHILLQLDDGSTKSLPALTTSLVHDA